MPELVAHVLLGGGVGEEVVHVLRDRLEHLRVSGDHLEHRHRRAGTHDEEDDGEVHREQGGSSEVTMSQRQHE